VPVPPCYVDLHGQINQPITKSPLLMSCYANHMTQLACSNWSVQAPQPGSMYAANAGTSAVTTLTAVGIPHFSYISEGFTPGLMVEHLIPRPLRGLSRTAHDPRQKRAFADTPQNNSQADAGKYFWLLIILVGTVITCTNSVCKHSKLCYIFYCPGQLSFWFVFIS